MLTLDQFNYTYPNELIALYPATERSGSRLYVIDRKKNRTVDLTFKDFFSQLTPGDLVVFNNSKVIKARFHGVHENGNEIELLYVSGSDVNESFEVNCLTKPAKKVGVGDRIELQNGIYLQAISKSISPIITYELKSENTPSAASSMTMNDILETIGEMPLPPYIKRKTNPLEDNARYQTVFAETLGSIAAPTASLHFDEETIQRATNFGIQFAPITLHVGLGTFYPIRTQNVADHELHKEWAFIPPSTAELINQTREKSGRIVAVGTTVIRTIESAVGSGRIVQSGAFNTNLFIYPEYTFKVADAIITNFHQPKSSLILCIAAFCGREKLLAAYNDAIQKKYRLFSYGDAMMVL